MMKIAPDNIITRFAPSPTGALHLGHLYSALYARKLADRHDGQMRLRIDDIDFTRCRDEYTDQIYDNLEFMGIHVDGPVLIQSQRMTRYQDALSVLLEKGVIYPCSLSRHALNDLLSAPHGAHQIIRNTDRLAAVSDTPANNTPADNTPDKAPAWRLRMDAITPLISNLRYRECDGWLEDIHEIPIDLNQLDDVVIARKDIGASYHLSVVLDDHDSGVTIVTRGDDLLPSTPIHRLLQELLALPPTIWAHHDLINGPDGTRLAKRDSVTSLQHFRKKGYSRDDIIAMLHD